MNETLLCTDALLEQVQAQVGSCNERDVTCSLCDGLAACADHSTIFFYEYEHEHDPTPQIVATAQARDRNGRAFLPWASHYLWNEFALRTVVPETRACWLLREEGVLPPGVVDLLANTLDLKHALLVPLAAQDRCLGCALVGWREAEVLPADTAPFVEILVCQAAGRLALLRDRDALRYKLEQTALDVAELGLFRSLLENAGDAIDIVDLDGINFYANPAFMALYGFESLHEALVGADPIELTAVEDRQRLENEILPRVQAGEVWQGQLQRQRQDGTSFTAALTIFSVQDEKSEIAGVATIARDETDRLRLEQSLNEQARLREELIATQRQLIQEISTPTIPVAEGILVMPLIGNIDALRAKDIMRALLAGISEHRARVVILDITGVPLVDSGVASYLNKAIVAAKLKGTQAIITGISRAVAETIVDLGIDWSGITTLSSLQLGIQSALRQTGRRIVAH